MSKKDLVIKAVEKLRQIKGLPILFIDFVADTTTTSNTPMYLIKLHQDSIGEDYELNIIEDAFTEPARARDLDEPTHLPWDELIVVRVAKLIYNDYKTRIWNSVSSTVSLGSTPISNTLNVSSINIGGTMLSSSTITDLETKVKDLNEELEKAKTERDSLLIKVLTLESELKSKGVI